MLGVVIGAGIDLGLQLALNNWNINCVSWTQVGISGALGGVGGGLGNLSKSKNFKELFKRYLKDEFGGSRKIGPSGKPMIHRPKFSSRKRAKDAGRIAGDGEPMQHSTPIVGNPHFHAVKRGKKLTDGVHFEYPGKKLPSKFPPKK